ncbi:hypothetical protein SEUCBS140593_009979 [Sporothrix eucalyptigena]|uniref:Uncharacterized protein n=1 Tax=Sporothrix eucalyptigena TaxID=1812306 RepID=A0ABP0CZA3_9PEZI
MDMRVTELESRIGEVERMQMNNDNDAATVTASSITSVSDAGAPLSTTTSITSRTPRTASAPDPAMLSRMKALEEHISLLEQSTLPSPTRPWQLEVVFLPFPLKGIWVEAVQFGPTEVVASAAAAQRRQSGAIPSYGDADGEDEWMQTIQQADTPRLLPRACVPGRNIDRRLRSRGLVQTVTVRGADANSIHTAMVVAFGAMLRVMASNNTRAAKGHCRSSSASLVSQFLGLQHSWVPLRKVHKQSRLRLLKCSEMVTPAVWDVNFMTASVVMKASGTHRLYVTQPAAYLQNREAYAHGWSWQKLRELPQVQVELENGSLGMDDACWAWDSKLDEPPAASTSESASSSSLSPLLIASRMHRPSPSPFSREGTPTGRTRAHRASSPSMLPTTTTAAAPIPAAPAGRSHSVSIGTSGSSEQFFTVAQSPMQQRVHQQHLHQTAPGATIPTASITLRRSLSPFFSSTPSAGRRVPPPIRTTSVPVPQQVASPAMMKGASSGAASRRRIHSAGSNHPATAISAPPLSAGINKRSRRCSTRSPSFGGHWPRNTPRYSRSPSMTPGPGAQNIALWATSDQHRSRQRRQSRQPEPQRARGTTPFAYATPFSTGADHFPPTSASSVDSGSGRRKRQRQERHERQFQYRRNSRHGSCGPLPAVLGHANNGQNYYDDEDMMVVGYDSDDVDDFDYPMTQEDEDDDNDDDADDIEVYEDEQDMLGLSNYDNNHQEEPGRQLLPKDQPRPGVEFDVEGFDVEGFDIEEFDDDDDDEDFIGHTFGAQHHHGSTQDTHDDEDESMSDSENMDPSISLFGDNNVEDEQPSQQQHQDQPGEDNRSDHSSQPSEYPSTRRPWRLGPVSAAVCEASTGHHHQQQLAVNDTEDRKHIIIDDTDIGFKIHEDGDASNL